MPDTPTTRLSLYKSASDGSEDVDYTQDLGNNWDAIDQAVGALAVTTSTFPSAPWSGQLVRDTDTDRLWVSNGTSPASGSWSEITTPGTAQTFTKTLTLDTNGTVDLYCPSGIQIGTTTADLGGGSGAVGLHNATTAPTGAPDSGGVLYVQDGALKYIGSDSSTPTLLAPADGALGAWQSYTPEWSTTSGSNLPSLGNAVTNCRYCQIGNAVFVQFDITFGSTTDFGGGSGGDNWAFGLPVPADNADGDSMGFASMRQSDTAQFIGLIAYNATKKMFVLAISTRAVNDADFAGAGYVDSAAPWTWASTNAIHGTFMYRAA